MGDVSGCPLSIIFPGADGPHSGHCLQSDYFAIADPCLEARGRNVAHLWGAGPSRGQHHQPASHAPGGRTSLQRHSIADVINHLGHYVRLSSRAASLGSGRSGFSFDSHRSGS